MQYKGAYNSGTPYSVGDVVIYTDEVVYIMEKAGPAGSDCHNSRFWNRVSEPLASAIRAARDAAVAVSVEIVNNLTTETTGKALDAAQGKALKDLVDARVKTSDVKDSLTDSSTSKPLSAKQGKVLKGYFDDLRPDAKTLRLQSSTASSEKLFDITVNDSGELSATEYTPPAAGGES